MIQWIEHFKRALNTGGEQQLTVHVVLNLCFIVRQMGEEQTGHCGQSDSGDGRRG